MSALTHVGASVGIPRFPLVTGKTPLEPMTRLEEALGRRAGTLWVKRDDTTGLAGGGNKVRKLEYEVAAALAQGCDWLVTGAGVQSNAARATAAAAVRAGLRCTLVLDGQPPPRRSGNLVLDDVLGADVRFRPVASHEDLDAELAYAAEELRTQGARPYVVAVGASTPLGALGYVDAASEIREELPSVDVVVVATGSAGTHAGLVAGFGTHDRVLGVRVGTRADLATRIERLAAETAVLAGLAAPVGECRLAEDQLGAGYGEPTPECFDAIRLAARTEALILDPVYTGKAMAGLIAACRDGRIADDDVVVFLHTGGLPGLLSDVHADRTAVAVAADTTRDRR